MTEPQRSLELAGARSKLLWGNKHLDELRQDWARLYPVERAPGTLGSRLTRRNKALLVYFETLRRPLPHLSLIVGDALHNYRSALDNVAWALARLYRGRKPSGLTLFPLATSPEMFRDPRRRGMMKDIDPAHQVLLEQVQPYRQPWTGDVEHPLVRLGGLSNQDKHRSLNIVDLKLVRAALLHKGATDCEVVGTEVSLPDTPLQEMQEFGRFLLRPRGPSPQLDWGASVTFVLALKDGLNVIEALISIAWYVKYVIDVFDPLFPPAASRIEPVRMPRRELTYSSTLRSYR